METISLTINLPANLLQILNLSQQEMEQESQAWIVMALLRAGKITLEQAVEIINLPQTELLNNLQPPLGDTIETHPLTQFAGILSDGEAETIQQTIHEEFSQIDDTTW